VNWLISILLNAFGIFALTWYMLHILHYSTYIVKRMAIGSEYYTFILSSGRWSDLDLLRTVKHSNPVHPLQYCVATCLFVP